MIDHIVTARNNPDALHWTVKAPTPEVAVERLALQLWEPMRYYSRRGLIAYPEGALEKREIEGDTILVAYHLTNKGINLVAETAPKRVVILGRWRVLEIKTLYTYQELRDGEWYAPEIEVTVPDATPSIRVFTTEEAALEALPITKKDLYNAACSALQEYMKAEFKREDSSPKSWEELTPEQQSNLPPANIRTLRIFLGV